MGFLQTQISDGRLKLYGILRSVRRFERSYCPLLSGHVVKNGAVPRLTKPAAKGTTILLNTGVGQSTQRSSNLQQFGCENLVSRNRFSPSVLVYVETLQV